MRRLLVWLLALAIAGLAVSTAAGLLAPLQAEFDLINHFRPHLAVAALAGAVVAAILGARRAAWTGTAVLAVNVILALTAMYGRAEPAPAGAATLKVVTLNVWWRNGDLAEAEQFLRDQDADIIVLNEATPRIAPMLERLKGHYPHQAGCLDQGLCRLALLSKLPFVEARAITRAEGGPPMIHARYRGDSGDFDFYGVHLARPFGGGWQEREIGALIARFRETERPVILAGDFNATPWSWALLRLMLGTGLRRHGTLGATWPVNRGLPFAQVLIDNVLTSATIRSGGFAVGAPVGSDHLPVIARLVVTGAAPVR